LLSYVVIAEERDLVTLALVRKGKDGNAYTTAWFDMFRVANGNVRHGSRKPRRFHARRRSTSRR
jgi:predicted SnoaL-like aldol condensation-catalyzing enzyme